MHRVMLKSKIHRATVSDCDPHHVGSITIDPDCLAHRGDTITVIACAQCDAADLQAYAPRVVHVEQDTNTIIDADSAVATLLS